MAELVKTTADLQRAYVHGQVRAATNVTAAWHVVVEVQPAVYEYWIVTP